MTNTRRVVTVLLAVMLCILAASCGGQKEPEPDQLQTPQYNVEEPVEFTPPPEEEIHTADQGVKVIAPGKTTFTADMEAPAGTVPLAASITPDTVWESDAVVTYNAFTLPEKAAFDDGSIGVLSISKIGLSVLVYESDDQMEDMDKGLSHFRSTSAWDGNCALSGHNSTVSGYDAYFKDLHLLAAGDTLTYRTALGEREYKVTTIQTVGDEDWSWLSRTTDNRLTLITCVNNNASKRLMVQAVQN